MVGDPAKEPEARRASWTRWLLVVPFIAVLWVPFYNGVEPAFFGVPLFYWYQLLWVLLCALVIGVVYLAEHRSS